jgi:hypothetical protein
MAGENNPTRPLPAAQADLFSVAWGSGDYKGTALLFLQCFPVVAKVKGLTVIQPDDISEH